MLQCPDCAKTFKSKSGLRRHHKAQHPAVVPTPLPIDIEAAPHEETVADNQDAQPGLAEGPLGGPGPPSLMRQRDAIEPAPAPDDEKVLKTKTKHILKFNPTGKNRYALRITIENDVVVDVAAVEIVKCNRRWFNRRYSSHH